MAKINVLPSKVFNRISAGEVVERPSSVVKELVENSLDAGATSINIEILSGGIAMIRVSDNGEGIEKTELKNALLPHATSKISKVEDLNNIITLGFRGEALASIASVSKIRISSITKSQEFGATIYAEGGLIKENSDYPIHEGTEITVNNLFFNTPVREKFLKTPRTEENEISAMVARFILGNPNISFKYYADDKLIFQSFGDGIESAIVNIYGAKTIEDCFYINCDKHGVKISGYIGKHYFTKGNKSYQTLFINGRYVVNQTISSAIYNAYSSYLMKRQYPFYVLSISIPTEMVDVNVHPNKIDVRFLDNQIIYGILYSVISKVLDGSSTIVDIVNENKTNTNQIKLDYATHNSKKIEKNQKETYRFDKLLFADSGAKAIDVFDSLEDKSKKDERPIIDVFAENKAYLEMLEKKNKEKLENAQQEIKIESELRYVGQAINTFLIFDDGQDLYLIDQHAAHERVLYDKIIDSFNGNNIITQPLLIPYVLNVNSFEYEFLTQKLALLNQMGIGIDEFGLNTFKISFVPNVLVDVSIEKFFNEILDDVNTLKNITLTDVLKEKFAQKACKSAIKAGDKMTESEVSSLLELIKGNLGLKCPHGRPIAVKITRMEIDKWFKRIV